jgi:hypothetical protein
VATSFDQSMKLSVMPTRLWYDGWSYPSTYTQLVSPLILFEVRVDLRQSTFIAASVPQIILEDGEELSVPRQELSLTESQQLSDRGIENAYHEMNLRGHSNMQGNIVIVPGEGTGVE